MQSHSKQSKPFKAKKATQSNAKQSRPKQCRALQSNAKQCTLRASHSRYRGVRRWRRAAAGGHEPAGPTT
eukprot:7344270-Pyramimonas_sp.AAC.1